ncbi:MAG TPA: hypothetical protein VL049_28700 [Candidatus Dormibacteraeota bacterium]|nr:hypothetical protein [Candidatus Dormibacteraeota bacterium]
MSGGVEEEIGPVVTSWRLAEARRDAGRLRDIVPAALLLGLALATKRVSAFFTGARRIRLDPRG